MKLNKELEKQKREQLFARESVQVPYLRLGIWWGSLLAAWLLNDYQLKQAHFLVVWLLYALFILAGWLLGRGRWLSKENITAWWVFSFSVDTGYIGYLIYSTGGVMSPVAPLLAGNLMRVLVVYPHFPSLYLLFFLHLAVYCLAVLFPGGSSNLFQPEFWFTFLLLCGTSLIAANIIMRNDEISLARLRLARERAELKTLAVTDGLTEIYNYRYFRQCLKEEIQRAARFNIPLSLLIFDIDLFKTYNDTFGHPAGDQVLKVVAALLRSQLRDSDILCRYGGDEFVAILVGADGHDARLVASKAARAVEEHPFEGKDALPGGKLSISVGVATYPEDALNHADLVAVADRRLYAAKGSGGGRDRRPGREPAGRGK